MHRVFSFVWEHFSPLMPDPRFAIQPLSQLLCFELLDDVSLVLSATFLLTILACRQWQPKLSSLGMIMSCFVWLWTMVVWAQCTQQLIKVHQADGKSGFVAFGLTWVSHLLCCCFLAAGQACSGNRYSGWWEPSWWKGALQSYAGGACVFYGQFLTVVGLSGASAMTVYTMKAAEPLTTILLAAPLLGERPKPRLGVAGAVVSGGVLLAQFGRHGVFGRLDLPGGRFAGLAGLAAFVSNFGFSVGSCTTKLLYTQGQGSPVEAMMALSSMATLAGCLPFVFWPAQHLLRELGIVSWAPPLLYELIVDAARARIPLGLWIRSSVSFSIYTCLSSLILESVAIEHHSLLLAATQVITGVLSLIMAGDTLGVSALVGAMLIMLGVAIYTLQPQLEDHKRLLPFSRQEEELTSRLAFVIALLLLLVAIPVLLLTS